MVLLYKDERTPREYKVFDRCPLFDKRLFHGTVVDPVLVYCVLVELTEHCRMIGTISSADSINRGLGDARMLQAPEAILYRCDRARSLAAI